MKKLVLFLFLFVTTSSIAQLMKIHVTEVQSFFGDTSQSVSAILSGDTDDTIRVVDCEYILDLNQSVVSFYKNDKLIARDPISINIKDSTYRITFLNEPINYGLIIDMLSNSCTLYEFNGSGVEYMKFIEFELVEE